MIRIGQKTIGAIAVGARAIGAVYHGVRLVWQKAKAAAESLFWKRDRSWKRDDYWTTQN